MKLIINTGTGKVTGQGHSGKKKISMEKADSVNGSDLCLVR